MVGGVGAVGGVVGGTVGGVGATVGAAVVSLLRPKPNPKANAKNNIMMITGNAMGNHLLKLSSYRLSRSSLLFDRLRSCMVCIFAVRVFLMYLS